MSRIGTDYGLDDLRVFSLIADAGGISAAARRHSLPKATLARALARLEGTAGTQLFDRVEGGLRPTAFGERLLDPGTRAVRLGRDMETALLADSGEPQGLLRIVAAAHSGLMLAAPVAAAMVREWPGIRASLRTVDEGPGSWDVDIDVMLSLGRPPQQHLVSRRIVAGTLALYTSRSVAATLDINDIDTVSTLPRVAVDNGKIDTTWRLKARDGRLLKLDTEPAIITGDPLVTMEVVANGTGMTLLSSLMVDHARHGGTLVRVLPEFFGPPIEVYLSFVQGRGDVPAVRKFIDALVSRAHHLMDES